MIVNYPPLACAEVGAIHRVNLAGCYVFPHLVYEIILHITYTRIAYDIFTKKRRHL